MLNDVYIRNWGLTYFLGFLKRFLRDLSKLATCLGLYVSFFVSFFSNVILQIANYNFFKDF